MDEITKVLWEINEELDDFGLDVEVEIEASLPVIFHVEGREHEAEIDVVISQTGTEIPNARQQIKEIHDEIQNAESS